MAKAGRKAAPDAGPKREDTRQRIIEAAFATLRDRGYAQASARVIADTGGFNQAQIFYYFGSVNNLLVAALEWSSLRQLAEYRAAVAGAASARELLATLRGRLESDLASGHVKVLAELIGAGTSDPSVREKVRDLFEPWIELSRESVTRLSRAAGLGDVLDWEQVAFGVVCLFLGVQQMVTLTGDAQRVLAMVDAALVAASMFDAMFPTTKEEAQP